MEIDIVIEACAHAAHEANRAYQIARGEKVSPPWDDAPAWMRESAKKGVEGALAGNGPRESHDLWLATRRADGWVYGPEKDEQAKTHPCLVEYDELAPDQKIKDALFLTTVRTMLQVFMVPVGAPRSEIKLAEAMTIGDLHRRLPSNSVDNERVVIVQGI